MAAEEPQHDRDDDDEIELRIKTLIAYAQSREDQVSGATWTALVNEFGHDKAEELKSNASKYYAQSRQRASEESANLTAVADLLRDELRSLMNEHDNGGGMRYEDGNAGAPGGGGPPAGKRKADGGGSPSNETLTAYFTCEAPSAPVNPGNSFEIRIKAHTDSDRYINEMVKTMRLQGMTQPSLVSVKVFMDARVFGLDGDSIETNGEIVTSEQILEGWTGEEHCFLFQGTVLRHATPGIYKCNYKVEYTAHEGAKRILVPSIFREFTIEVNNAVVATQQQQSPLPTPLFPRHSRSPSPSRSPSSSNQQPPPPPPLSDPSVQPKGRDGWVYEYNRTKGFWTATCDFCLQEGLRTGSFQKPYVQGHMASFSQHLARHRKSAKRQQQQQPP